MSSPTKFVKPADGARIRQPERAGRVLPEEGDTVVMDAYYERLLLTGDIVEGVPATAKTPEPQKPNAAPLTPGKSTGKPRTED